MGDFGVFTTFIPQEETLTRSILDISSRGYWYSNNSCIDKKNVNFDKIAIFSEVFFFFHGLIKYIKWTSELNNDYAFSSNPQIHFGHFLLARHLTLLYCKLYMCCSKT